MRSTSLSAWSISSLSFPSTLEASSDGFGPRLERGRRCVGVGMPVPPGVGGVPILPGVEIIGRRDIFVGLGGVLAKDEGGALGELYVSRFLGEGGVSIVYD